ncbi:putative inner membrane protein [Pseudomonas protegens Cab57]|nr:putative inner membrane protein [Pseudomonas protegens Cab57]
MMIAIAESDIKYLQVKKLLNGIVISFGLFTLAYTAYMLATDFKELGQEKTFYDFVVPALLTVMYLPFVFAMMTYSTYETVFVRLQFTVQDKKLRNLAKLYAVLLFNFRLDDIRRWADHIARVDVISHKQLLSTFVHLRKLKKLEKMKPEVVGSQGWSPYLAKDFLLSEGVSTGHYNLIFSDQWCASSKMYDIGDDLLCDNFAYYVEGVEGVAKVLKIKLNVNDNSRARQANERLLVLSGVLVRESLGIDISHSVKDALRFGAQHRESHGDKQIIVKKTSWGGHKLGGYDLKIEVVAT